MKISSLGAIDKEVHCEGSEHGHGVHIENGRKKHPRIKRKNMREERGWSPVRHCDSDGVRPEVETFFVVKSQTRLRPVLCTRDCARKANQGSRGLTFLRYIHGERDGDNSWRWWWNWKWLLSTLLFKRMACMHPRFGEELERCAFS